MHNDFALFKYKQLKMRKTIKTTRAIMIISAIFVSSTSAQELSDEDMTYDAQGATIVLDGDASDWGDLEFKSQIPFEKGGELVLFEEYGGGTWSGPSDHSSAVAFSWDSESLYIGLVVTDDTHQNGGSGWNGDSVQMVFANAAQDTVTHLYNYGLSDAGDLVIMNEKGPGGTEASITRDEDTTTTLYELKFPAASLGLEAFETGMSIGVGVCINDGDTEEGQGGQKGWSGWGPYAAVYGKTASATGLVTLVGEAPDLISDLEDVTNPGDTVTASSSNSPGAEQAPNAIDNNPNTKYLNFDKADTGLTIATAGSIVTGLGLTSANDAPERDPATFVLSGSVDGVNFTEIASGDVPAFGARFERQEVSFANDTAYNTYKLIFPTVVNPDAANSMQIAEVELLGVAAEVEAPPSISVTRNADGSLTVEFEGTLQTAPTVNGPWTDVDAASPVTWSTDQDAGFARSKK